jgi:peptidoglycan hydrolase-like protein with peptidoglycan-binding domain
MMNLLESLWQDALRALKKVRWRRLLYVGVSPGDDVIRVQDRLGKKADGVYGTKTKNAVQGFQEYKKQKNPNGKVNRRTWGQLFPRG